MPPAFYTIAYDGLVSASLLLAWKARRHERLLLGAAIILAASYMFTNIGWWTDRFHFRTVWPLLDGLAAAMFALQWLKTGRPWLHIMTILFLVSGLVHAWFSGAAEGAWVYRYDLTVNVTFLLKNTVVIVDAAVVLALGRFDRRIVF